MKSAIYQTLCLAQEPAAIEGAIAAFADLEGFEFYSVAGVVDRPTQLKWTNIAYRIPHGSYATWSTGGAVDPVVQYCKRRSTPLYWDCDFYERHGAVDIWQEMAAFGMRSGIAQALHLPGGRHVLVGLERSEPTAPEDDDVRQSLLGALTLFTSYAIEPVCALIDSDEEELPALTDQELECLRWRGEGKSAWETGRILGLSESRINHLSAGVARKMNCVTVAHAAFKALRSGLIE